MVMGMLMVTTVTMMGLINMMLACMMRIIMLTRAIRMLMVTEACNEGCCMQLAQT